MSGFWLGAGLLIAVALGFLLRPIWVERRHSGRWPASALGVALATAPLAVALYLAVTTWNPAAEHPAAAAERAMVAQLAAKMVENPDDVEGWLLLGRSYMVLGEYGLGRQAYVEAWNRTANPDNELKLALGEALILTDRRSLTGDGGQLIEEVLRAEPNNARALWYGGLVAMETARTDAARARWTRFLGLIDPQEEIAGTIRGLLAQLPADTTTPATSGAPGDQGFALEVEVSIADAMPVASIGPSAALFIFARAPGERAPIAVIRQPVEALPRTFTLSDGNVMIAGRSLTAYPELSLVARVSLAGQPAEQPGDLYAEAVYRQGETPRVSLVIDKVVP